MFSPGANYINCPRLQWDHRPNLRGKGTFCQLAPLSHAQIYALFPLLVAILLKSSGLAMEQAVLLKEQNLRQNRSSIVRLRTCNIISSPANGNDNFCFSGCIRELKRIPWGKPIAQFLACDKHFITEQCESHRLRREAEAKDPVANGAGSTAGNCPVGHTQPLFYIIVFKLW